MKLNRTTVGPVRCLFRTWKGWVLLTAALLIGSFGCVLAWVAGSVWKKSAVTVKGLTFEQQGNEWEPTGGAITCRFLGQKGTANLMDFILP